MDLNEKVEKSADFLLKLLRNQTPRSAMICGSGWAKVADDLKIIQEISYDEIPALTNTQVEGHKSVLMIGETEKGLVVLFLGRRHYYEGEGWGSVIAPILLIHELAIDKLVLTNAAGGINEDFDVGDIMLLEDHINMMGNNPLIGGNIHPDIPRFPDQTNIYNAELRNLVERMVVLSQGEWIDIDDIPSHVKQINLLENDLNSSNAMTVDEMEKEMILQALDRTSGNRTLAAEKLGMRFLAKTGNFSSFMIVTTNHSAVFVAFDHSIEIEYQVQNHLVQKGKWHIYDSDKISIISFNSVASRSG